MPDVVTELPEEVELLVVEVVVGVVVDVLLTEVMDGHRSQNGAGPV
ncbi:hypothetical protein [Rhodopseudomonas sp. B29]|nr:hypothetical protein [Rhodopseudomonas sp. B29]